VAAQISARRTVNCCSIRIEPEMSLAQPTLLAAADQREVLTGLDLQRYRPTVIIVEATLPTTRIETHSNWDDLLTRADYAVGTLTASADSTCLVNGWT
jgi:hypothetical protein